MYGTCKPGTDDYFWTCSDCGAVVIDRERHDRWHAVIESQERRLEDLLIAVVD